MELKCDQCLTVKDKECLAPVLSEKQLNIRSITAAMKERKRNSDARE